MSSRLRKVEHIEVFDMEGEMVAKRKEEPFSYTVQCIYYYGQRKLFERKKDSRVQMSSSQLKTLKRRVNQLIEKHGCCYVDDEESVDVVIRGGSTNQYTGKQKNKFFEKVLDMKMD